MDLQRVLRFCEAERSWAVETTAALAARESPTGDKPAVDACGAELVDRLTEIGGVVEVVSRDIAGNHLCASFGQGARQLLVLGHFDTVWPAGQLTRMPVREESGILYGPGVYDMKGGIALGMLALRARAAETDASPVRVVMLLTSDEEQGSETSRSLVEDEARRSEAVLVLEPSLPGGAVKTARKATGEFTVHVHGVAAHAGIEPDKGASAIDELAHQLLALHALRNPERGITLNVGRISGGGASNVVAAQAEAVVDLRVSTEADRQAIEQAMAMLRPHLPRTSVEVRGRFSRSPFERTESVARLYRIARDVAADLGRDLGEGSTGGGSDGNLTAALGIPTLDGLGAVGAGAHALHEQVQIDALPWRAALVAGLIDRVAEDAVGKGG